MRPLAVLALLALVLVLHAAPGAAQPPQETGSETTAPASAPATAPEDKADAEIGKSAAEEVEKQFKVIEESPELPRIAAIIERLRPVTQKAKQSYEFKVIDSDAINAFSLPGGYLYYTRGLLEAVESEDELAAVTAHEMAHVCLNHSRKLMSKDERYQNILGSLILVSVLTDSEHIDPGAIAVVGGMVLQDALNHYGREAELEADENAVLYLAKSKQYSPVAMLTVVEALARLEGQQGAVEMGVFQTHPYGKDRVQAVIRKLQELGIAIERRRVTRSLTAEAARVTKDDREIGELRLNGRVVFQPAAELDGVSPVARAERSAELLNSLLLANLQLLEIMLLQDEGGARIEARGETIVSIVPADADFHGSDVKSLADQAVAVIRVGFREEKVQRAY